MLPDVLLEAIRGERLVSEEPISLKPNPVVLGSTFVPLSVGVVRVIVAVD